MLEPALTCAACGGPLSPLDTTCPACGTAVGLAQDVGGQRVDSEGLLAEGELGTSSPETGSGASAPSAGPSMLQRYRPVPSSPSDPSLAEPHPPGAPEELQVGPPSQPADSGQRLAGPLIAAAGVALLLVATVVALSAFLSPEARPGASAAAVQPTVSAAPVSPVPTSAPTVAPSVDPGIAIRDAFFRRVQDPKVSYRVTMTGLVHGYGDPFHWSGAVDVSGDDFAGFVDSTETGSSGKVQFRKIEDVLWLKSGSHPWTDTRSGDPRLSWTPFLNLGAPHDLDYADTATVNGRKLHVLKSTTWYQPDRMSVGNFSTVGLPLDDVELTVYVLADGAPVSAVMEIKSGGAFGFQIVSRATYAYSRFGKPVTISEPPH